MEKYTKLEIQQRITYRDSGAVIDLDKFTWDEKFNKIQTNETNLLFDFKNIDYINFYTNSFNKFIAGWFCNFVVGSNCEFDIENDNRLMVGFTSNIKMKDNNILLSNGGDINIECGDNNILVLHYSALKIKVGVGCQIINKSLSTENHKYLEDNETYSLLQGFLIKSEK